VNIFSQLLAVFELKEMLDAPKCVSDVIIFFRHLNVSITERMVGNVTIAEMEVKKVLYVLWPISIE
jgi:hypothetical protein